MKIIVGQVSEEERNETQTLYERKNGLMELAKAVGDSGYVFRA
jgi:CXXX repeat modification system protein